MSKQRILLDVDGPLTDGFAAATCALLREYGYENAYPEQIKAFNIFESFNVDHRITDTILGVLRRPGLASSFMPRHGVPAFLAGLCDWADVYAVTSPLDGSHTWAFEREVWLIEYLGFDAKRIISTRDKTPIKGDVFVDDRTSHIREWAKAHPTGHAILWEAPYNIADGWGGAVARDLEDLGVQLNELRP